MEATTEEITQGRVSPTGWIKLSTGSYADPNMILGPGGEPLTDINIYQAHMAANKLGLRLTDDIEYNALVNEKPSAAKQMRKHGAWTSILRDVEPAKSGGSYTARLIARPVIGIDDGQLVANGSDKPVKLPKTGYFTIRHLLESEDGLPHETFPNPPDEPWAYLWIEDGEERPVQRGLWLRGEPGEFDVLAIWGRLSSDPFVGARAAYDSEPKPIILAKAEAIRVIEKIGKTYGLAPAEIVAALNEKP